MGGAYVQDCPPNQVTVIPLPPAGKWGTVKFGRVFFSLATDSERAYPVDLRIGRPGSWLDERNDAEVRPGRQDVWTTRKLDTIAVVHNKSAKAVSALVEYEQKSERPSLFLPLLYGGVGVAAVTLGFIGLQFAYRLFDVMEDEKSPIFTGSDGISSQLIAGGWLAAGVAVFLAFLLLAGALRLGTAAASDQPNTLSPPQGGSGAGFTGEGGAAAPTNASAMESTASTGTTTGGGATTPPASLAQRRPAETLTAVGGLAAAAAQVVGLEQTTAEAAALTAFVGLLPAVISYLRDPGGGLGVPSSSTAATVPGK